MRRKTEVWVIAGIAVVLVVVAIAAAFVSGTGSSAQPQFNATSVPAISSADHTRGGTNAKVTVTEYGDFQCPACGEYEPIVEQVQQNYGTQIQFVFRNFPLYQIHQDAMIAAQAAEAANLQGKYWEMHDLLYTKQTEWSTEPAATVVSKYFNGYAQSLGLNVTQFDTDINSDSVKARVQRDIDSGNAAQIDHTPTFFINLRQIPNPNSYADFKTVIDAALASSTTAQ